VSLLSAAHRAICIVQAAAVSLLSAARRAISIVRCSATPAERTLGIRRLLARDASHSARESSGAAGIAAIEGHTLATVLPLLYHINGRARGRSFGACGQTTAFSAATADNPCQPPLSPLKTSARSAAPSPFSYLAALTTPHSPLPYVLPERASVVHAMSMQFAGCIAVVAAAAAGDAAVLGAAGNNCASATAIMIARTHTNAVLRPILSAVNVVFF